jgi:amino acid adenylation domain-containing protein
MTTLLQHWVTEQAEQRPEAVAVRMREERLTYGQLEESSNQLARMLKAVGCLRGDRVCLLMPKSPKAIVGIVGILKADCIYVPLDTSNPACRLASCIVSCEPRCLLAAGPVGPLLNELWSNDTFHTSPSVGWMGEERDAGQHFAAEFSETDYRQLCGRPLNYLNTAEAPAYILFTSGSTGTPKGVVITHDNVRHFIEWAVRYFGIGPDDRLSGHPPLYFDLSVFDIFGTFAAGAQLHLVTLQDTWLPQNLADFIRAAELTQWFSVPAVLTLMAKFGVVRFDDFPTLKRLLWCGEVLPTPTLISLMQRLPHVQFTNLYGPTEATVASSYYTAGRCPETPQDIIPIGTACDGEALLVLNDALQLVRPGEVGDLYIRGVGLSPGYWRDVERTHAAFLPNPHSADPTGRIYKTGDLAKIGDDGLVYFLGRADSQIKSRGYRIELGEIETALHTLVCLQEAAVVAIPSAGFEGTTICCAYVPLPGVQVKPIALRQALSTILPSYMLPSQWLTFDQLPKNPNGKIDRRRLQEDFQHHAAQAP